MKGGFGEVFKKAPSLAGDVMGDATSTDIPGLPAEPYQAPQNLMDMATQGDSNFSFSPLHQPQGGNNPLMDELFPGMSAEEAAEGQGMSMEEFMPWLQSMGSK